MYTIIFGRKLVNEHVWLLHKRVCLRRLCCQRWGIWLQVSSLLLWLRGCPCLLLAVLLTLLINSNFFKLLESMLCRQMGDSFPVAHNIHALSLP